MSLNSPDGSQLTDKQESTLVESLVGALCSELHATPSQLLHVVRTIPDDVLVLSEPELEDRVRTVALVSGSEEATVKWGTMASFFRKMHIVPSKFTPVVEKMALLELTNSFVDNQYDLLYATAARKAQVQSTAATNAYMAYNWAEIREWLTFPRGLGVWSAVLIAVLSRNPMIAVLIGCVLWILMAGLATPLWKAGHEEGDLAAPYGEDKSWWRLARPFRMFVTHWLFRWSGVAAILLSGWSQGLQFNLWWLPLGALLLYDVVRTTMTANHQPVQH